VHRLAGVFLEVDPVEADRAGGSGLAPDLDAPARRERPFVLRDLVALREVRVEVVLPLEDGRAVDPAAGRQGEAQGEAHHLAVQDGERARVAEADGADGGVRARAEDDRARAERLRPRLQLGVDFQPDDRFEVG
jgi:hypothetical protein